MPDWCTFKNIGRWLDSLYFYNGRYSVILYMCSYKGKWIVLLLFFDPHSRSSKSLTVCDWSATTTIHDCLQIWQISFIYSHSHFSRIIVTHYLRLSEWPFQWIVTEILIQTGLASVKTVTVISRVSFKWLQIRYIKRSREFINTKCFKWFWHWQLKLRLRCAKYIGWFEHKFWHFTFIWGKWLSDKRNWSQYRKCYQCLYNWWL